MRELTDQEFAQQLLDAHKAGKAWAEGFTVGDVFKGTRPEGEERYPYNLRCQRMFSWAALDVLDNRIISTDDTGIITSYKVKQ